MKWHKSFDETMKLFLSYISNDDSNELEKLKQENCNLRDEIKKLKGNVVDPMTKVVLDIDGVIAKTVKNGEYNKAEPLLYGISQCNALVDKGFYVILHTARYGERFPDRQYQRGYLELLEWLHKHNVNYSEVRMGKPAGLIYADDKGCKISGDNELGWKVFWEQLEEATTRRDKYGNFISPKSPTDPPGRR